MPLVLAIAALLDETRVVNATCPVDQTRFRAIEVLVTNQWGGVDYDNCPHAYRTTPLEYRVWTCPTCAFSGPPSDFTREETPPEDPPDEATCARLREGLCPLEEVRRNATQDRIPGWVKFDLWAQALRLRGADRLRIGYAFLSASWSARQQGAVRIRYVDEHDQLWEQYALNASPLDLGRSGTQNRTDYEIGKAGEIEGAVRAGRHEGVSRALALYIASYLHRRHGENVDALRILESIREEARANTFLDEAVETTLASIDRERSFQRRAIEELAAAVGDTSLPAGDRAVAAYILGELHARLGERDRAREWYDRCLANPDAPEPTRRWAERRRAGVAEP